MASYCEVCRLGLSPLPHPHELNTACTSRGPSPVRAGDAVDGARGPVASSSPSRRPRQASPFRPPSQPAMRAASPYGLDSRSSQGYTRGTYSSEQRRSATSSPLRHDDSEFAWRMTGTTNRDGSPRHRARRGTGDSKAAALASVLSQMHAHAPQPPLSPLGREWDRWQPDSAQHSSATVSPDGKAHDRSYLYRYTHEWLPPRRHRRTTGHREQQESNDREMDSGMPPLPTPYHPYESTVDDSGNAISPLAPEAHLSSVPLVYDTATTTTTSSAHQRALDAAELRHQQAQQVQSEWQQSMTARMEELRRGFVDLCGAVRADMQALEARCGVPGGAALGTTTAATARPPLRSSSRHDASTVGDGSPGSCDRPMRVSPPMTTSTDEGGRPARGDEVTSLPALVHLVRAASEADRRQLAKVLWEDLQPFVRKECQRQQQKTERHLQEKLEEAHDRVRTQLHSELSAQQQQQQAVAPTAAPPPPSVTADAVRALLPVDFSSPDALEAHLRAVARKVLAEEDTRRIGLASMSEQRHQEAWRAQQESWETALKRAERGWRREYGEAMATQRKTWAREDLNEVYRALNQMQQLVEAVTRDMASLTHKVSEAQARQASWMETEASRRHEEFSETAAAVQSQVRSLLQEHQTSMSAMGTGAAPPLSSSLPFTAGARLGTEAYASADAIRAEVVQPAMAHMKRLLAAHQQVVDATVERRCALVEQSVADRQHMWEQHVAELRSKVSSLRTDVRSAFSEMCQSLNMAAPGL